MTLRIQDFWSVTSCRLGPIFVFTDKQGKACHLDCLTWTMKFLRTCEISVTIYQSTCQKFAFPNIAVKPPYLPRQCYYPLSKLFVCRVPLLLRATQQLLTLALTARSRDMTACNCEQRRRCGCASLKRMSFADAMHTHTLVPLLADRSGYIGVHTTPLPYLLPAPPRIPRLL